MNDWWVLAVLAVASYLFGCFNNAIIISKLKKTDVRNMGSGNPGTLNMSRNFGLKIGLLVFFLDVLKGLIPTLIGFFVMKDKIFAVNLGSAATGEFALSDLSMYLCGFCAVLGHIYPVFFKFKGGKGIATTIGVFIASSCVCGWAWIAVQVMSLIAAVTFIYFTEFGAMGSFLAITPPAVCASIRMFIKYGMTMANLGFYIAANMIIFGICFFTWFAHRKNIERMLAGEEHPTSIKEMIVKMKAKKQAAKAQNALPDEQTPPTDQNDSEK